MKTLKQHIKEHMYTGGQVGAATSNAVEDGQHVDGYRSCHWDEMMWLLLLMR